LNIWRAVGYIFLGWGSVFLILALLIFFGIVSVFSAAPIFGQVSILISLAASAPWLVLASLLYVVGFVGYYAGRETVTTSSSLDETDESASSQSLVWPFSLGVLAFLGVLALQFALGFMNGANMLFGVALPIFYSVIAGSIVGLVACLIIDNLD
jgi:hypothetical protein